MAFTAQTQLQTFPTRDPLYRRQGGGAGVISGITQIDGVTASCRVFLYAADGVQIDYVRTEADGVYSFSNLASGTYRLIVEDDMSLTKQGMIVRVDIA